MVSLPQRRRTQFQKHTHTHKNTRHPPRAHVSTPEYNELATLLTNVGLRAAGSHHTHKRPMNLCVPSAFQVLQTLGGRDTSASQTRCGFQMFCIAVLGHKILWPTTTINHSRSGIIHLCETQEWLAYRKHVLFQLVNELKQDLVKC